MRSKKGLDRNEVIGLILAVIVLVVFAVLYIYAKTQSVSAVDFINSLLRFG